MESTSTCQPASHSSSLRSPRRTFQPPCGHQWSPRTADAALLADMERFGTQGDVRDLPALQALFKAQQFDAVVHLAGGWGEPGTRGP